MASASLSQSPALPDIVIMPGLDGSGPHHWQSLWEERLPNCRRVKVSDWSRPVRSEWVEQLDREVRVSADRVIIVAHSLGCLNVAWWAKHKWKDIYRTKIVAALLVAPPCLGKECRSPRLLDFRPTPKETLPFESLLVASRNDPYCSFETAQHLAESWGSRLVDAGPLGHINADSGVGEWEDGLGLLERLIVIEASAAIRSNLQMGRRRADSQVAETVVQ